MKHFFFNNEKYMSWDALVNCYIIPDEKHDGNRNGETHDIIEVFKHVYDAADIIYDRRVDPDWRTVLTADNGELIIQGIGDDLLRFFLESFEQTKTLAERIKAVGANKAIVQEVYDSVKQDLRSQELAAGAVIPYTCHSDTQSYTERQQELGTHNLPGLMLTKTLLCLWNYTADIWKLYTNGGRQRDSLSDVYFYLTAGNISRRISQCYYTMNRDFACAEEWGRTAIEMIWHGKNCCKKGRIAHAEDEDWKLLELLLDYNTGTHYLDYAKRNRRSNNDSAERYFGDVNRYFFDRENLKKGNHLQRYLLLYIESLRHLIIVDQRRNRGKALDAAKLIAVYRLRSVTLTATSWQRACSRCHDVVRR